jgi:hypothetical protein
VAEALALPVNTSILGLTYDIGPNGASFEPSATVCFTYNPDDIPEGVNEENLAVATWDTASRTWVNLRNSTVDTDSHTICAPITHLSYYAILAYHRPADFELSRLTVIPSMVNIGHKVIIGITVTNTGDLEGTYTAELTINGSIVDSQTVTLAGGAEATLIFNTTHNNAGICSIAIGSQSGTFVVREAPASPAEFIISNLEIARPVVYPDDTVVITVLVNNTGGQEGIHQLVLQIDGQTIETREIILADSASLQVKFMTSRSSPGTYSVEIDGLSGTFDVIPLPTLPPDEPGAESAPISTTPSSPVNWWLLGGISVVALLTIFLLFRLRIHFKTKE